jgi:DNA-binding transcriptional MerR regulator
MNIQRAAVASGLSATTIRFYEREGILPLPPRQLNGYRDYSEEHVETLRLAVGLRALGLSLNEMSSALTLVHDGTCGDVRTVLNQTLAKTLEQMDSRIEELAHSREQIVMILDGLGRMLPGEDAVPGMTPCACVQLVEDRAAD